MKKKKLGKRLYIFHAFVTTVFENLNYSFFKRISEQKDVDLNADFESLSFQRK